MSSTKKCPICGAENNRVSLACGKCGASFALKQVEEQLTFVPLVHVKEQITKASPEGKPKPVGKKMVKFAAFCLFFLTVVVLLCSLFIGGIFIATISGTPEEYRLISFSLAFIAPLVLGLIGLFAMFMWEKRGDFTKHLQAVFEWGASGAPDFADKYVLAIFRESRSPLWQILGFFAVLPLLIIGGILLLVLFISGIGESEYPWNIIQWAMPSYCLVIGLAIIKKLRAVRGYVAELGKELRRGLRFFLIIFGVFLVVSPLLRGMWQAALVVAAVIVLMVLLLRPWKQD